MRHPLGGKLWGLMALAVGCGDGASVRDGSPQPPPGDVPPAVDAPPSGDAAWVFAEAEVRTYELALSAGAWAELQASAADEAYTAASLRVNGELVGQVGLRFKGGFGSLELCFDAAGERICPKLSMKIKFDEYDPELRFYGLKRLNFNSMGSDPSHLHERLAYRLFREMGVVAPRSGHARLVVNGESMGLFSLVEQVDGRFTDAHFEGGDGNLYKEQWPDSADRAVLDAHLENNQEAADHGLLLQFTSELGSAPPADLPNVVGRYMDVDNLLAYVAVDRATRNWDGITAFYCFEGGCKNHNYYLYQHEREAKLTLIPWDLDNTFALASGMDDVPSLLQAAPDCAARYPVFGIAVVMAPGCDPLLAGLAGTERSRYQAQLTRLLQGPFAQAELDRWLDARLDQLEPFVAEDVYGPGLPAFEAAVEGLRQDLGLLSLRVAAERDGEEIERFRLAIDATNDFEAASAVGLRLGASALSAPESSFGIDLLQVAALAGERDLELAFVFRDGAEPWTQWARLRLPFAATPATDLNPKSSLVMLLRADTPRTLRISFDSAAYTQPESGATFGWDVRLDGSVQAIELPLGSATYPEWGPVVPEALERVLGNATALLFDPVAEGRTNEGYLGAGRTDPGRIRIDDIRFLP